MSCPFVQQCCWLAGTNCRGGTSPYTHHVSCAIAQWPAAVRSDCLAALHLCLHDPHHHWRTDTCGMIECAAVSRSCMKQFMCVLLLAGQPTMHPVAMHHTFIEKHALFVSWAKSMPTLSGQFDHYGEGF